MLCEFVLNNSKELEYVWTFMCCSVPLPFKFGMHMRFLHVFKKFTLYVEFVLHHVVCNCQVEVKGIIFWVFFGNDTQPMYVEGNIWLSCI